MPMQGIYLPHVTPFTEDGELDLKALSSLISHWAEKVDGFVSCASNGEGPMLTLEERINVLEVVKSSSKGKPVFCGVSGVSTREVLRQMAVGELADGFLVTPPYFFKPSREELSHFYREVLDTGHKVILYNVPKFVGYNLPLDLIVELSSEENVIGLKESSGLIWRVSEVVRNTPLPVLSGTGDLILPTLVLGGKGTVTAVSMVAPELVRELFSSFERGDLNRASELQRRLTYLNDVLVKSGQISAVKEALNLLGLPAGFPRRPYLPLSPQERDEVVRALRDLGLLTFNR